MGEPGCVSAAPPSDPAPVLWSVRAEEEGPHPWVLHPCRGPGKASGSQLWVNAALVTVTIWEINQTIKDPSVSVNSDFPSKTKTNFYKNVSIKKKRVTLAETRRKEVPVPYCKPGKGL